MLFVWNDTLVRYSNSLCFASHACIVQIPLNNSRYDPIVFIRNESTNDGCSATTAATTDADEPIRIQNESANDEYESASYEPEPIHETAGMTVTIFLAYKQTFSFYAGDRPSKRPQRPTRFFSIRNLPQGLVLKVPYL